MQASFNAELRQRADQLLVQRIELVATLGDKPAVERLLQPNPLEHRRLVERGRRVRVVLQQLCRTIAGIAEIQAAVEISLLPPPAPRDVLPERFGNAEAGQHLLVLDGTIDDGKAHLFDLLRRRFEIFFDLPQGEAVIGAFVPVGRALDGMKCKAVLRGGLFPIGPLRDGNALHGGSALFGGGAAQPPAVPTVRALEPKPPRDIVLVFIAGARAAACAICVRPVVVPTF